MGQTTREETLFHEYFKQWVHTYKKGRIPNELYQTYVTNHSHLKTIAPTLKVSQLGSRSYKHLVDVFARTHDKNTTTAFHHQVRASVLDAVHDEMCNVTPKYGAVTGHRKGGKKKPTLLTAQDVNKLTGVLELDKTPSWDWLILTILKTGTRFYEALALTPADIGEQKISVKKAWDYKNNNGATHPKNNKTVREVPVDSSFATRLAVLGNGKNPHKSLFVAQPHKAHNSSANHRLKTLCHKARIQPVTVHSLRHTHAALLLKAGVPVTTVAHRLGHSTLHNTQKTYESVIKETQNRETDKALELLTNLG